MPASPEAGEDAPFLEIADRMLAALPGITGLIDRLEGMGLLARRRGLFLSSSSLVFSDRSWYGPVSGRASRAGHLETATLQGGDLKECPPGWRGVCRILPSTGLEGERSWSRAERSAEVFDLDDEMLRAKG
jgi:hypothetical protein